MPALPVEMDLVEWESKLVRAVKDNKGVLFFQYVVAAMTKRDHGSQHQAMVKKYKTLSQLAKAAESLGNIEVARDPTTGVWLIRLKRSTEMRGPSTSSGVRTSNGGPPSSASSFGATTELLDEEGVLRRSDGKMVHWRLIRSADLARAALVELQHKASNNLAVDLEGELQAGGKMSISQSSSLCVES